MEISSEIKIYRILLTVALLSAGAACSSGPKWDVWTVTETRHVLRSDLPSSGLAADIFAARHEWVSFQILMRSDGPLKNVRIEAGELAGPGGASLSLSDARLYRQHQLHIEKGTDRNAEFRTDWYPDPLILAQPPSPTGKPDGARFRALPFDLPAGETHGFFVDLFVPDGAAAGEYRGVYHLTAHGAKPIKIPVSLTVWDFALPSTPTLVTEFGSPAERLRSYYRQRAEAGSEPEPVDWAAVEEQCNRLLSENRCNAVPPRDWLNPQVQPEGSFSVPQSNVEALREFIDRYHVNAIQTPHPDTVVKDPVGERGKLHAWLAALDQAAKELDRPHVVFFTYLKDEPNTLEDYRYVQKWGSAVREAKSAVEVLVVEQPWTAPGQWHADSAWGDLYGAVDIWCPLFSLHRPDSAAMRQAQGETIWTYTALCQFEPTPWWHIDYPLLNYRVPAWMAWADGMKGLLYWGGMSYWRETEDPWTHVSIYTERAAEKGDAPAPIFNGEGSVVYPARATGFDGIVPTIRLKALRDAIEDYEYLAIAERLGKADEARRIVRSLARSFFDWDKDSSAYEKARAKLAELIVSGPGGAAPIGPVTLIGGGPEIPGYKCLFYPIPYDKLADSIWDCAAGPDGKIYIGMCSEHSGGSAHLLAFDPATETFEDIFDAQVLTKSPADRMPQGKIHFTLNAHPDGRLFGATHFGYLKFSPDEPNPNPKNLNEWNSLLTDPERGYPGGHLFVYDTKTKQARDLGMPIEFQGIRVMTLDKTREHLYGLGALDNYLFHYDIKAGKATLVGKVAGYNPYGMVVDERDGTMYTSDGTGHIVAYRPGWPKIKRLPVTITGVDDPERIVTVFITGPDGSFYGVDHVVKHLFRFDPKAGPTGSVTDMGRFLAPDQDCYVVESLAFDKRGVLFALVPTLEERETGQTFAVTTDTKTGEKTVWGPLECRGERMNGCYRMTMGPDGSLYAGSRMDGPVGGAGRKKIEPQGAFWLLRIKPD